MQVSLFEMSIGSKNSFELAANQICDGGSDVTTQSIEFI